MVKSLKKKFLNAVLVLATFICGVATSWGVAIANVKADAALENEFTNNGQFSVTQYATNTLEYVDGIPGADGAVLKVNVVDSGSAYVLFNAPQVKASDVAEIVVRIYSPEYSSSDSFRAAPSDLSSWLMNNAYDMSSWCDVTLSASVIAAMTDANGYLSSQVAFGARVHGTATAYYIDSITITTKAELEKDFSNDGQFTLSLYDATVPYSIVNGASVANLPAGYEGTVLQVASAGGAGYVNVDFSASKIRASFVKSVVARVYSPDYTVADELRINGVGGSVGVYDMSTWCDVSLPIASITGADGNLGAFLFGIRDKGTISQYFYIDSITVTIKETTAVAFTGVHSYWNNYFFSDMYCSILEFGGIAVGNIDGDYTDIYAKMTLDGQPIDTANFSYICRAWIDGQGESMIMRWVSNPSAGAILYIPAGARFTNGSTDPALYEIAADAYLQFNGTTWELYTPPAAPETISVSFTNINSIWNNYIYENSYCTFLHFDGGISGNGGLDGDYSDLLSKMTMNGSAVDTSNVSVVCPNWVGASGGIILRFTNSPAAGTKLVMPAGASFNIGGTDINTYVLASDVTLLFNGEAWAIPATINYYVFESTVPEILHSYTAMQNADGSFTYTLPEYTMDGKVLLGYVMNSGTLENLTQTFIPSGEYATAETVISFIALWGEFTTIDGASIRIASAETSGIRWTTTIDAEGFNNIAYWTKGAYTFGTELSAEGFAENFDIVTKKWKVENNTYTGVLIDITSNYYDTVFTARGYVDITYANGVTKRIYAQANDTARSIRQVATLAVASGNYTGTQLSILEEIAGV